MYSFSLFLDFIKKSSTQIPSVGKAVALVIFFSPLALIACGEEESASDPVVDQRPFVGPALDRSVLQPIDSDGALIPLSAFGEPCRSNGECVEGWCVPAGAENVCTRQCLGDNCPEGWGCRAVSNSGVDLTFLCTPADDRLCGVCAEDSDCPEGRCLVLDGLSICGRGCLQDEDCPESYRCAEGEEGEVSQCVPRSGSCTCGEGDLGEERVCEVANEFGACFGRQRCDGGEGWSTCDAATPAPEQCNLVDDDCNGLTDDILGLGEVCSEEVVTESGETLSCTGRLICTSEALAPICTAQAPSEERCDFLDNDCDGETDEGFDGRDQVCQVGIGACRRFGVQVCSEDGAEVICNVGAGAPVEELCDGIDNDCDGSTDEDFSGVGQSCSVGVGLCQSFGDLECLADGSGTFCDAVEGIPVEELCDGADNDCDGSTDELFPELGTLCEQGRGACRRVALYSCSIDGSGVLCEVEAGASTPERCDGVDNDCDGEVDEAFPNLTRTCEVGEGICLRRGVTVCGDDELSVTCSVVQGEPAEERCDGLDNDCDGVVDQLWEGLGAPCELGEGLCRRRGVLVCAEDQQGAPRCDAEQVEGAPQDLCDYQDDDCDGEIDEDFRNEAGGYQALAHCGACGNDCLALWDPNPAAFGVEALCEASGDLRQCGYRCLPGFSDADGRARNGCELSEDLDAVYVLPAEYGGADNENCGRLDAPCASITQGLDRAVLLDRARVRVAEGVYRESVSLRPGIDLLGGHDRISWVQQPEVTVSRVDARGAVSLAGAEDHFAVSAVEIRTPTRLEGFTIQGSTPIGGGNSYGIYVKDCDEQLTIRANFISAGDGGRGADGSSGVSGRAGLPGRPGLESSTTDDCFVGDEEVFGGSGGILSCGAVDVSGGPGGSSYCPYPHSSQGLSPRSGQEGSGIDGLGGAGGLGGEGAWSFQSTQVGRCTINPGGPGDASDGEAGQAGADGAGGQQAETLGRIRAGHWRSAAGGNGVAAGVGSGGGGGGAAAGIYVDWASNLNHAADLGASGGGGGSGGCPGEAGGGGGGGGSSFAISLVYVNFTPLAIQLPRIEGNTFRRGLGGRGGRGGSGGGGGIGGAAGRAGQPPADTDDFYLGFCAFQGGAGGVGGRGGHAGGGAGGNGGRSFDIALFHPRVGGHAPQLPVVLEGYGEQNLFTLSAEAETLGEAGEGGNSINSEIGVGASGRRGDSGRLLLSSLR
ncbi:MAG: MopE-related protein [Myxococcota bacterium]|nr:MopE-related protein [Myxococcota bacterium]